MGTKILNILSHLSVICGFCLLVYFGFLFLVPVKVISYASDMNHTVKDTYYTGESLTTRAHFTKYKAITAKVSQSFVDGVVFQLPIREGTYAVGSYNGIDSSITVPAVLPTGKYHLESVITFKVNHFQDVVYTIRSNDFTVINTKDLNDTTLR